MALLGPEGSTFDACERLKQEHKLASSLNITGLVSFFVACLDIGFLLFPIHDAVAVFVQVAISMICIVVTYKRIQRSFKFDEQHDGLSGDGTTSFDPTDEKSKWVDTRETGDQNKGKPNRRTSLMGKAMDAVGDATRTGASTRNVASKTTKASRSASESQVDAASQRSNGGRFSAPDNGSDARRLVKSGIATKEGSWYKNWKPRYFELYRDFIVYYESKDGLEKGKVALYDTSVDQKNSGHKGRDHGSFVTTSTEGYTEFVCVTPTSRLSDKHFKEYKSRKTCLQIRVDNKFLYMEFITVKERDEWADAITKCAVAAKNAAQQRANKSATIPKTEHTL
jgi:hypothetical protein